MFLLRWETDPDILWKAIQHGYISLIYEKIMGKALGLNSPGSYGYGLRERQHRHNLENMNWAKIFNITIIAKKKEAKVICAMCMLSHFSHAQLRATTWTLACQAPLSMEISKQEYWIGLPCPLPGDLLNPGIEPVSPASISYIASGFFTSEPLGKPKDHTFVVKQSCV